MGCMAGRRTRGAAPPLARHLAAVANAMARLKDEGVAAVELAVLECGLFPHTPEQRAGVAPLLRPFCGVPHSFGITAAPPQLAAALHFVLGLGLTARLRTFVQLGAGPTGGDFVFVHHVLRCCTGGGVHGYLADTVAPSTLWRGRAGGAPTPYDGVLREYLARDCSRGGGACAFVLGGATDMAARLAGDGRTADLLVLHDDGKGGAGGLKEAFRALLPTTSPNSVVLVHDVAGAAAAFWQEVRTDCGLLAHEFRGDGDDGAMGVLVRSGLS
jgi:hypothetical protein